MNKPTVALIVYEQMMPIHLRWHIPFFLCRI